MKINAKKAIGAACAVGAAAVGSSYLVFREVMKRSALLPQKLIQSADKAAGADKPDERVDWFNQQHFDEFVIESDNGSRLRGYLLKADEPSDIYVFCSHGYRSNGKKEFKFITKYHHDRGRNVFLVDHQASGESEGKYIGFGYHEHLDCMKWMEFMVQTFGENIQIILHGISMGCATVMLMCGDPGLPENVKFAVADCGYTSAPDEFKYVLNGAHLPSFPIVNGADFFNKKLNGFNFRDIDAIGSVARAKIPMLFIHGKTDTFVPTYMATELFNACSSQYKDLLLVDDAWHAESYLKNSEGYEAKVDEFAYRFIYTAEQKKVVNE